MKTTLRHFPSLLLLAAAAPLCAQDHDLRVATKKGASVWLQQETKMEQAIDMGGQQMDMGNATTTTIQATVVDVDAKGVATVEMKVARIQGSMTLPMMGDVEFDSLNPAPEAGDGGADDFGMPNLDAIGAAMASLAGNTFVVKIDARGEVVSMDGVEKVLDAARKKAGRMGSQMLGGQLNEGNVRRLAESLFGERPEQAVAVGGAWETSEKDKAGRNMQVVQKLKSTLAKASAEAFEVTVAGTVEKPAGTEPGKAAGDESEESAMAREMMSKMEMKNGKITGSAKYSRTDGFVVESASTMSMSITAPSPMGGDMAIDMTNRTTVKRVTEAAAQKAEPAKDAPAKEGEAKDGAAKGQDVKAGDKK
ncbi:MAG: hypothetical protein JNK49_02090 [Planctomycetes bacterium]|nr:hypothetical protein [Planctomycetota bacterium]